MAGRHRETFAERRERRAAVDDPAVVLEAAARFLEARSRSVMEVRRRLTTAGYRADLVESAIDRLTELGVLDDEAFAQHWTESRDRARPRGERAIREELRRKGVEPVIVEEVLAGRAAASAGGPAGADRAAADRLLARHARTLDRVVDPRTRRQRAYALLARNGFDPETCREAVTALLAGDRSVEEDDEPASD